MARKTTERSARVQTNVTQSDLLIKSAQIRGKVRDIVKSRIAHETLAHTVKGGLESTSLELALAAEAEVDKLLDPVMARLDEILNQFEMTSGGSSDQDDDLAADSLRERRRGTCACTCTPTRPRF
jgi:hypothetical protein